MRIKITGTDSTVGIHILDAQGNAVSVFPGDILENGPTKPCRKFRRQPSCPQLFQKMITDTDTRIPMSGTRRARLLVDKTFLNRTSASNYR